MSRQEANKNILSILQKYVLRYPDWRFGQIMFNSGLWDNKDPFYEESIDTLNKLANRVL